MVPPLSSGDRSSVSGSCCEPLTGPRRITAERQAAAAASASVTVAMLVEDTHPATRLPRLDILGERHVTPNEY